MFLSSISGSLVALGLMFAIVDPLGILDVFGIGGAASSSLLGAGCGPSIQN
jgi:hypothetical protein